MPSTKNHGDLLDLDTYLPYRLSILSNTVSGAIAAIYQKPHGLSVAEWRIMAVLGMSPPQGAGSITQKDLCVRTRMDKVQVSRAVKRLLQIGLISKATDDRDRRRAHLTFTPAGRAVYDQVAPATLAWERAFLDRLSAAEVEALDKVISRMQQVADDMAAAAP